MEMAIKQAAVIFLPDIDVNPIAPPKKQIMQGGGGGGDRSPLPASFGKLPKPSLTQYTPPVAVFNNMNPKLAMAPSILAPPDTPLPQAASETGMAAATVPGAAVVSEEARSGLAEA